MSVWDFEGSGPASSTVWKKGALDSLQNQQVDEDGAGVGVGDGDRREEESWGEGSGEEEG